MKRHLWVGWWVVSGWVGCLQAEALVLQSPLDWQVIQRSSKHHGTMRLLGLLPPGTTLEWRVSGQPLTGQLPSGWQTLPTQLGECDISADILLPSGGWYRLEIQARRNGQVVAENSVEHFGIGEVFVVAGQSNSANYGEERQSTQTGRVCAFDGSRWQLAQDPQPGASGTGGSFLPPLGDALVKRFQVPVGFIATGVGATSVREWLPAGTRFPNPPTLTENVTQLPTGEWESRGTLFTKLTALLGQQGTNGVRAVLWHQGESDANQKDPTRTLSGELYRKYLEQLIRDSRDSVGWSVPWFVAQVSYHTPDDPGSPEIRAAQETLWKLGVALAGPDSDALTGAYREGGGQGVHFSGAGLREHAKRWEEKVGPWLENQLAQTASQRAHPEVVGGTAR